MKTIFLFFLICVIFFFMLFKLYHLLSFFIGVELIFMTFFISLLWTLSWGHMLIFLLIVLLAFSVCESVVALVLFVLFSRVYSKDYFFYMNFVQF